MVFAQKPAKLKAAMAEILENAEANLTPRMRNLISTLWGEWKTVEQQMEELGDETRADLRSRPRLYPHTADPWHWARCCYSDRCGDRQRRCLP